MVRTPDQEHTSATATIGTRSHATATPNRDPTPRAAACSRSAHWAAKHSSAAVATERPINTLESQESIRPNRCTSARGMSERKPQPSTNTAESHSCLFRKRPTRASAVADWRATRWAVRCQPQALMTATAQRTVHHAATPLDRSSTGRWTSRTLHTAANAALPAMKIAEFGYIYEL